MGDIKPKSCGGKSSTIFEPKPKLSHMPHDLIPLSLIKDATTVFSFFKGIYGNSRKLYSEILKENTRESTFSNTYSNYASPLSLYINSKFDFKNMNKLYQYYKWYIFLQNLQICREN